MHARLGLEPTVGVLALDLDGGGLDAGLLAGALLQQRHLVAALFRPAHVHAQQHLRPILALGAAGAGMDLEIGIEAVGLAGQQRLDFALVAEILQFAQRHLALLDGGLVGFRLAELDQGRRVIELALELAIAADRFLQRRALAHQLLRLGAVAPQRRILGAIVQLGKPALGSIPVKDASAARRETRGWNRPASRVRHALELSRRFAKGGSHAI